MEDLPRAFWNILVSCQNDTEKKSLIPLLTSSALNSHLGTAFTKSPFEMKVLQQIDFIALGKLQQALLTRSMAVEEGLLAIASGIVQTSCKLIQHTGKDQPSDYTVVYHEQREGEWSGQSSLLSAKLGQNLN